MKKRTSIVVRTENQIQQHIDGNSDSSPCELEEHLLYSIETQEEFSPLTLSVTRTKSII